MMSQSNSRSSAHCLGMIGDRLHMMRDQIRGSLGDRSLKSREPRGHVILGIDRLADIMQESRKQELLVIGTHVARPLENLKAMVKSVSLGMKPWVLLHPLKRHEKHSINLESIDSLVDPRKLAFKIEPGNLASKRVLKLGDRRALDRLAGDRAFEHVMRLILGIKRQLERISIFNMNVCENTLSPVLDDSLVFNAMLETERIDRVGHVRGMIREHVDVDIRTFAHVPRKDAADQSRSKPSERPHHPKSGDTHLLKFDKPFLPLVDSRSRLNLIANFAIRREIGGAMAILDPQTARGLPLGGEIFGFKAFVHKLSGENGDLPSKTLVGHEMLVRRLSPSRRRGAWFADRSRNTLEFNPHIYSRLGTM